MEEPDDMASMIPIARVESLLEQQRFVPGYGGPKVSVTSGTLPDLGFVVPLPENTTDLTSVHYKDLEHGTLELIFSSTLPRDQIESFYKAQLGARGYSVSANLTMQPRVFKVSGEAVIQPLILCGGPQNPAWSIAVRSNDSPSTVFIRIHFDPEHSPCAQNRGGREFHRGLIARMPSLSLPEGTKVQNLGSSASDREVSHNASLSGDTSIAEIVSSLLNSLAETQLTVVASEIASGMGFVEWSSVETGDVGIVTVVRFGGSPGQFDLTSRMRPGSSSPPTQFGGFTSMPLL